METHEMIKSLRKQTKMSQAELARRAGYKDRSSIAKIEAGMVDLSRSKIAIFASIFGISPAELMGITEESYLLSEHQASNERLNSISRQIGCGVNSTDDGALLFKNQPRTNNCRREESALLHTIGHLSTDGRETNLRTLRILGELVAVMSPEDQDRLVSYAEFIEAERQKRFGITVVHPYQQGSVTLPEIIDDADDMPDAEALALARQILQDKKAQGDAPASSGDNGSKKMA